MGTNFYLMTKSKETRDKYFGYYYELTDTPEWGYNIHIAKTSCGWLPLFQAHNCFKSIKQLKELYNAAEFIIYDEYGNMYSWDEFDERVLKFNGGVRGVKPRVKYEQNPTDRFYDPRMPKYLPVSHLEYDYGFYASDYFTDEQGFEFTAHDFS